MSDSKLNPEIVEIMKQMAFEIEFALNSSLYQEIDDDTLSNLSKLAFEYSFLLAEHWNNDDERVSRLLNHPRVHIGASDGGAHILSFSTYGDTGYLLSRFVRDKKMVRLEDAIKKVTSDTASIWGIPERGLIRTGYVADIAVFDPQTVDRGVEKFVQDVPGDGSRYVRDSHGVDTVIVGGGIAWSQKDGYRDARGEVLPGAQEDQPELVAAE